MGTDRRISSNIKFTTFLATNFFGRSILFGQDDVNIRTVLFTKATTLERYFCEHVADFRNRATVCRRQF